MTAQARRFANDNLGVFNHLNVTAVLSTSSGCGATLDEYSLMGSGTGFKMPVLDISQFLNTIEWPADLRFQQNNCHVMIHDPCSLRHVMHREKEPYKLLNKIPGLGITPLPGNERCCGAAGSYMLSQPDMADSLRDDKIAHLAQSNADYLVTSNIGCAIHLMAGSRAKGLDIEVIHPVTLLERQLIKSKDARAHD